ncbi:hypothetical protein MnTg02_01087 [bacterium MnTg02]|nr:hypothetical protein MnTg02_01087 [bacterium MnTg02]
MFVIRSRRHAAISASQSSQRYSILAVLGFAIAFAFAWALFPAHSMADDDSWSELRPDLFGAREIHDGSAHLSLEAPYRAYDAALVPITINANGADGSAHAIKTITLVIDENPVPVAAVFHLAPESGVTALSTRVRLNAYTYIRVIAEMKDGKLYMVSRFVKASGGCSAPATKDYNQGAAGMGKMRLRQYLESRMLGEKLGKAREVQLQIRHPNLTGFQMDEKTGGYFPAHYVEKIEISQGKKLILSVDGAISLSEDPALRFRFTPVNKEKIQVRVVDNKKNVFSGSWDLKESGATNM